VCPSLDRFLISGTICHGPFVCVCVFDDLKQEAVVRFVDISGIVDYHCLNSLSIIRFFKNKSYQPLFEQEELDLLLPFLVVFQADVLLVSDDHPPALAFCYKKTKVI